MVMPGRSFVPASGYRYGVNGQEKDDEVSGSGNTYTASYWEYDDRLCRRWNVDPEIKKFPSQSPYLCFNGNPLYFKDRKGNSGEVSIDYQTHTITVTQLIVLYGSKGSEELAKQTAQDIEDQWNAANGTVMINGEKFNVRFSVAGTYMDDEASKTYFLGFEIGNAVEELIESNTDYSVNYYRVENYTGGNGTTGSYTDVNGDYMGGNTGELQYGQISSIGSTSEAHEIGHGIGLEHDKDVGGSEKWNYKGGGQPHIMVARGAEVDPAY